MRTERRLFQECGKPAARRLIHAFFAEREVQYAGRRGKPHHRGGAGIVAGTMGAGIAVAMLDAGLPVTMIERDSEARARPRQCREGTTG